MSGTARSSQFTLNYCTLKTPCTQTQTLPDPHNLTQHEAVRPLLRFSQYIGALTCPYESGGYSGCTVVSLREQRVEGVVERREGMSESRS